MSRRTAASNKAIREAWKNEKTLVKEGKGTRDWTIEQQKDILKRGKAYDENGKAFEGQHMRSAEIHPESQGDSKNIQFLTRAEHLDAHDGSWRNPTNWYYDPATKEKHDFGNGPIIPCKVKKLSKSLIKVKDDVENCVLDVADGNRTQLETRNSGGKYATVVDVVVSIVEVEPPLLYDLTSLQIEANHRYGLSAAETLACAQHLYEEGDVSYPRTSSRYITSDMENTVSSLLSDTESNFISQYCEEGMLADIKRLVNDNAVSDHSALLPTKKKAQLCFDKYSDDEKKILELLYQNLEEATSKPYKYEKTSVTLSYDSELFTFTGVRNLELGWKKNRPDETREHLHQVFKKGERVAIEEVYIEKRQTDQPEHFTDGKLLKAMEEAGKTSAEDDMTHVGIGTSATRAEIIEKLVSGGFVERLREENQLKSLVPTELARFLYQVLPDNLKSAELTADWEAKLSEVEKGTLDLNAFLEQIKDFVRTTMSDATVPLSQENCEK